MRGANLAIDLRRIGALLERILVGHHFEHGHAERIDIDLFRVPLLVQFGRHEFGCAEHRLGVGARLFGRQTEVACDRFSDSDKDFSAQTFTGKCKVAQRADAVASDSERATHQCKYRPSVH